MSSPGGQPPPYDPQRPPPPTYAPPPASYAPPAVPGPAGPGGYVDVDPRSAGLVREEKPGWALPFAVLGSLTMVVALFLDWIETQLFVSYDGNANGPLDDRRKVTSLFDAVDTVKDVTGPDPDSPDLGPLAEIFFPWLAIALTIACCVLVLAAAIGLRRAALTNTMRIAAVLLAVAAAGIAVLAIINLGLNSGTGGGAVTVSPAAPAPPGAPQAGPELSFVASEVQPWWGFTLWLGGAVLVAIGGALGPRIVHKLPPGAQPSYAGQPGQPGQIGWAPHPGAASSGMLRHTTQVVAIVLTSIATVLCVAGYGFVSWASGGDTVTFSDLGEVARDRGFGDQAFAEAYFGWLGWVVLLFVAAATLLVVLGKKPAGVNPRVVRPIVVIGSGLALVAHLAALVELDGDFGPAPYLVGLGLGLALLGALLPLRTTARVAVQQRVPFTGS